MLTSTTRGTNGQSTPAAVTRLRPARHRRGHTYDVVIAGLAGRLTVTELPDGRPAEVFLAVGKQGSTLAGLCEALSLMTSLALQHQVPLADVVSRLINMQFEPAGHTGDTDVPATTSIADYLGRRLAADYLSYAECARLGITTN